MVREYTTFNNFQTLTILSRVGDKALVTFKHMLFLKKKFLLDWCVLLASSRSSFPFYLLSSPRGTS